MTADVAVITPTVPERAELLLECRASVAAQAFAGVVEHRVQCDLMRAGPAMVRNALLEEVTAPFVAFLDDDDLIDADHLSSLMLTLASSGASVAYSFPRVTGPAAVHVPLPSNQRDVWRYMERGRNVIPVTVLARTSAIREAGCFDPADRYEDYALWMRLHGLGHTFALLPRMTWTYRMLGENRTHT